MNGRWLLAIAILGFSFAAAYLSGVAARKFKDTEQGQEVIGGLAIPSEKLDMGEVWEAKDISWSLPIRNLTSETIAIRELISSCGCTAVEPSILSIPAGETATVRVTLDVTHRSYSELGLSQRPFAVALRPRVRNPGPRSLAWKLHGTIKSRVTLDAPGIHFGARPIHGQTSVTQSILATVHVPSQRLEVSVNPEVATATVKQRENDPNLFEIAITANSGLPPGSFQTDAKISMVGPDGERSLALTLPIAGEMQSEVRLLPARVLLGPKPVGEMAEAVITLQAPPDAKVMVDHIEIDDPGLRVEPATIDGIPAGRAYRLRQRVGKEGEQTSRARFIIREPDQKNVTLSVEVCYHGESVKKTAAEAMERKQP